jgi:hypothetical protein
MGGNSGSKTGNPNGGKKTHGNPLSWFIPLRKQRFGSLY